MKSPCCQAEGKPFGKALVCRQCGAHYWKGEPEPKMCKFCGSSYITQCDKCDEVEESINNWIEKERNKMRS